MEFISLINENFGARKKRTMPQNSNKHDAIMPCTTLLRDRMIKEYGGEKKNVVMNKMSKNQIIYPAFISNLKQRFSYEKATVYF